MDNTDNGESKTDQVLEETIKNGKEYRPKSFSKNIYRTFFWCMMGVSFIYGFRLFYDDPPSPSFMPIIGAVFSAILSFTLVMALEHVNGPIAIKFGENFSFTGASGPIILWCICFLVIIFGLYLLGIGEISKIPTESHRAVCSVGDLIFHQCPRQL